MLGLPHMRADAANAEDSPVIAEPPSSSNFAMDAREGRVGNAFACERCRKHKVRCVPSDTASICQRYVPHILYGVLVVTCARCQKARVECIEHVARRRPAKSRNDGQMPNRIRDFDKKLDKLSAIVATMGPSTPQSALPPTAAVPASHSDTSQQTPTPTSVSAQLAPTPAALRTPILPAPGNRSEDSSPFWESINETLSCVGRIDPIIRSISLVHMQMLLDTYRNMVDLFPFVPLPRDSLCQDLTHQRPMLLLAVLTVSSHDSALLQLALSREFRKVVMAKVSNGEKNLDLLQGLIVFIAWHHQYMDAKAVSVPMLLRICMGLASELGLESMAPSTRSPLQKDVSREREAKRTYLGCYYLVSNIGLRDEGKIRHLSVPNILGMYASELASGWEHKSDTVLPVLIDICQFTEDVEESLSNKPEQALVIRSQVKRLSDKWDNIQAVSKPQVNEFSKVLRLQSRSNGSNYHAGTIQWLLLAARTRLYQTSASVEHADRETPWAPGFQLSLLVNCLRSLEQFLDNSIRLPANQWQFLSIADWLNLICATTSLSQLALKTPPTPGWDSSELQIARTFEYFRDQLSSQMPRQHDSLENKDDVFERFRRTTAMMNAALRDAAGVTSPSGNTFELATGSGRTVSLLQDLPSLKPNGVVNGTEKLPSLRQLDPSYEISKSDFHWKFLLGTV